MTLTCSLLRKIVRVIPIKNLLLRYVATVKPRLSVLSTQLATMRYLVGGVAPVKSKEKKYAGLGKAEKTPVR